MLRFINNPNPKRNPFFPPVGGPGHLFSNNLK